MSELMAKRCYDNEFKQNAVNLYINGNTSLAAVSRNLGIPTTTLSTWVTELKNKGEGCFTAPKELSPQEKVIVDLQKQVADLKMQRDILKKALAIFSKKK